MTSAHERGDSGQVCRSHARKLHKRTRVYTHKPSARRHTRTHIQSVSTDTHTHTPTHNAYTDKHTNIQTYTLTCAYTSACKHTHTRAPTGDTYTRARAHAHMHACIHLRTQQQKQRRDKQHYDMHCNVCDVLCRKVDKTTLTMASGECIRPLRQTARSSGSIIPDVIPPFYIGF